MTKNTSNNILFIIYVYYSFEYEGTKYDIKDYQDSFKSFSNAEHAILNKILIIEKKFQ